MGGGWGLKPALGQGKVRLGGLTGRRSFYCRLKASVGDKP